MRVGWVGLKSDGTTGHLADRGSATELTTVQAYCMKSSYVRVYLVVDKLELELELDASADPSHPTDDNGEESYSLYRYISPFVP